MTFKKLLAVLISATILFTFCAVGFSVSADQTGAVESARIVLDGKEFTAKVGSTFTYELFLCAEEKLEDVQIYFEYDNSVIDALPFSQEADDCFDNRYAPNLMYPVTNVNLDGKIKHNASSTDGFDFTEEKVLFTCVFKVLAAGTTSIDYTIEEMTILGNETSYFSAGKPVVTEGIKLTQAFIADDIDETTAPCEATTAPSEATTAPCEATTAPSEATEATEITTEAVDNTTSAVDPTEPAATVPDATDSTGDEPTEPTEPSTSASFDEITGGETTAPTETTEVTEPVVEGVLGDSNLDGKVNIKDVTLIQKYVANIESFDEVQLYLADTNKDTKVNIKDATAIQKFIAGIIKEF